MKDFEDLQEKNESEANAEEGASRKAKRRLWTAQGFTDS